MKLITYIISGVQKSIAFEWIALGLREKNVELEFILLNSTDKTSLQDFLEFNQFKVKYIHLASKKDYPFVFLKLIYYLFKNRPNAIHTHLRDADILGHLLGFILRIKKRITTRHSSTFNHQYFPKAVKWDKLVNWLSTDIISISKATRYAMIELENVEPLKITDIPHGFDLSIFSNRNESAILELKNKYSTLNYSPIIGVISRYISWKGIEYTIRAFKELLNDYPNAKLVLANANGDYKHIIHKELKGISKDNYIEIPFENDIASLYHLFDIFVHVPIDEKIEAFGQIYIESMAAGIPSVFTKSGIGNDICEDRENCMLVDYRNSGQIYQAMKEILINSDLKKRLIVNGKKTSIAFDLPNFIYNLEKIYS